MIKKTTSFIFVGDVVVVDGKQRKVTAKSKAFKAPAYFITFDNEINTEVFSSQKKWEVVA